MRQIILIANNIRSAHNVGSLLRTADGLGIERVILTGYTPYPAVKNDLRLPHLKVKISKAIHKTALGAEESIDWQYANEIEAVIESLKSEGYFVVALEQSKKSRPINELLKFDKLALIVGNEVEGVDTQTLKLADSIVEIPMKGQKESFNVAIAAAMTLYHLTLN